VDWLTFIASLVGSCAWPFAVLAIVWAFRSEGRRLLTKLTEVEFPGGKAVFGRVEELLERDRSAEVQPSRSEKSKNVYECLPSTPYDEIIERSPTEAVLRAWQDVEQVALDLLNSKVRRADLNKHVAPAALGQLLRAAADISQYYYEVLLQLAHVRNRVVHEPTMRIEKADAVNYCTLAVDLIAYLKSH
jgi:uncharacterized protein YutE (UPF0331/DUF86 family)